MSQAKSKAKKQRGDCVVTLCIEEEDYARFDKDPVYARQLIDQALYSMPELFPAKALTGYKLNGHTARSKKTGLRLRLLQTGGVTYRLYPHFLASYMRGRTEELSDALFLCRWAPYWAVTQVFGRNDMYWYRCHNSLAKKSLVGTVVQAGTDIPVDLVADEHHSKSLGEKAYVATTVADGCFLGAQVTESCGEKGLAEAYGAFREEAVLLQPGYRPESVNLDGWQPGNNAWRGLFEGVTIIACFLHGFIKVRDRAVKKMRDSFEQASDRIWACYRSGCKRSFAQKIRRLREWAEENMAQGPMKENLLKLCGKSREWQRFYDHPNAYRTSNMLDRLMRFMDRYLAKNQTFHGKNKEVASDTIRAFCLIYNFSPSCPDHRRKGEFNSPVARLNKHQYHQNWLANLFLAGSMNGKRTKPTNPI
jgi:hypothetical protein